MLTVPLSVLHNGEMVVVGETVFDENGKVLDSVIYDTESSRQLGFTPGTLSGGDAIQS